MDSNALIKRCSSSKNKINGLKVPTVTIKVEEVCLVKSNLKIARKNLKKIEKIYDDLNLIDPKQLKGINGLINPLLHTIPFSNGEGMKVDFVDRSIYYEVWFMFMDDIVHIQKNLIDYFEYANKGEEQPIKNNEFVDKIKMLMKPISVDLSTPSKSFKLPSVKLFVPQSIYDEF
jgi:hypothetical protein